MKSDEADSVLEIVQADEVAEWRLEPNVAVEYPIVVRNQTSESHEVEISIIDAVDWAVVKPERFSLRSGKEATAKLVLAKGTEARAQAGQHNLTLELHDFEGTSLGQLAANVWVVPFYALDMTVRVRGPLLRRGIAEGFVLHCTVVNRGNAEVTIHPEGESQAAIELSAPTVRVPYGGDVSFDIEAWWASNPMRLYPESVSVKAEFPGGQVSSEIPWSDVEAQLGTLIPPLVETEEFPEVLRLRPDEEQEPAFSRLETTPKSETLEAAPARPETPEPPTIVVQIAPPRSMKYTYGRRVNPWWPPAERFGGRWRVKPLPIAALVLVAGLVAMGRFGAFHQASASAPDPRVFIATFFDPSKRDVSAHAAARKAATAKPVRQSASHHAQLIRQEKTSRTTHPSAGKSAPAIVKATPPQTLAFAPKPQPNIKQAHGAVWEGAVVHVSAGNVKVRRAADGAVRSFIVSQNFKSVFSSDGTFARPMSDVRAGTQVRIFYSYVLGFRHPNAIFVLSEPSTAR